MKVLGRVGLQPYLLLCLVVASRVCCNVDTRIAIDQVLLRVYVAIVRTSKEINDLSFAVSLHVVNYISIILACQVVTISCFHISQGWNLDSCTSWCSLNVEHRLRVVQASVALVLEVWLFIGREIIKLCL